MNYLFIHIPKTAGTFVKKIIDSNEDNKNIFYLKSKTDSQSIIESHYSIRFVKKNFNNLNKIKFFTIVRNPYDRIYSIWKYLKDADNITNSLLCKVENNFSDFITEMRSDFYDSFYFFSPQHYFLQGEELNNIEIFKFEDINTKLKDFLTQQNYTWSNQKINVTNGPSWEEVYTQEMKEIVYNKYQKDFEIFNYLK